VYGLTWYVDSGWKVLSCNPRPTIRRRFVACFNEAGHGAASPEEAYTIARKTEAKNLLKATMSVCNAAAEMRGLCRRILRFYGEAFAGPTCGDDKIEDDVVD
jgi:hypothetical protein